VCTFLSRVNVKSVRSDPRSNGSSMVSCTVHYAVAVFVPVDSTCVLRRGDRRVWPAIMQAWGFATWPGLFDSLEAAAPQGTLWRRPPIQVLCLQGCHGGVPAVDSFRLPMSAGSEAGWAGVPVVSGQRSSLSAVYHYYCQPEVALLVVLQ
jgi:hypothetical protein